MTVVLVRHNVLWACIIMIISFIYLFVWNKISRHRYKIHLFYITEHAHTRPYKNKIKHARSRRETNDHLYNVCTWVLCTDSAIESWDPRSCFLSVFFAFAVSSASRDHHYHNKKLHQEHRLGFGWLVVSSHQFSLTLDFEWNTSA